MWPSGTLPFGKPPRDCGSEMGAVMRILIADDDRALRNLMRLVAARVGFEVDTAANGVEALEMLHENDYAIAVLDLMMPHISGYEVLERLGDLKKCPAIVVVTAMNDTHISGLDPARVNSILRKPFDIDMLAAILGELAAAVPRNGDRAASTSEPPSAIDASTPTEEPSAG